MNREEEQKWKTRTRRMFAERLTPTSKEAWKSYVGDNCPQGRLGRATLSSCLKTMSAKLFEQLRRPHSSLRSFLQR